ncbi:DUF4343 domain-containing protein [Rhizobium phage RHph_TM2_3B]|nr:DUF4343 domain-containing protein [Rhizobium phage RHph_TM2_3B]
MYWILQDFEDNHKLGDVLERMGKEYSYHKVVPFVGELMPKPTEIVELDRVVMFGSYSLRHYAKKHGLAPGVFKLNPYFDESRWWPYLLNGPHNMKTAELRDLLYELQINPQEAYFIRPVEDSKEIAGRVMDRQEIIDMVEGVLALEPNELIGGSLAPQTRMMFGEPQKITREWRLWVVNDKIVTASLYKEGSRVVYREELDPYAEEFAKFVISLNPKYSPAYVLDICRTRDSYKIIETNCINAAGFYAADLQKLVMAIEDLNHWDIT